MKISIRGRYGLEALFDLALNASGGPVSSKSIDEHCHPVDARLNPDYSI